MKQLREYILISAMHPAALPHANSIAGFLDIESLFTFTRPQPVFFHIQVIIVVKMLPKLRAVAKTMSERCALLWVDTSSFPVLITRWTYSQVWAKAMLIAARLRQEVTTSGEVHVGVMITEGPLLPIAELATHIAGFVIVPIDPHDPVTRMAYLMEDVECQIILCDNTKSYEKAMSCKVMLPNQSNICILNIGHLSQPDQYSPHGFSDSQLMLAPDRLEVDVSHIFFTSGSTGRPKGCICTHEGLSAYCAGKNAAFEVTEASVCFVASAHTFDPSLGDFFACWGIGACVATAPRQSIFTGL